MPGHDQGDAGMIPGAGLVKMNPLKDLTEEGRAPTSRRSRQRVPVGATRPSG